MYEWTQTSQIIPTVLLSIVWLILYLTKYEHPPELASSPVGCELLLYFLCEGERVGLMWTAGTDNKKRKEYKKTSNNVLRDREKCEHKETLQRLSSSTGATIDSRDTKL